MLEAQKAHSTLSHLTHQVMLEAPEVLLIPTVLPSPVMPELLDNPPIPTHLTVQVMPEHQALLATPMLLLLPSIPTIQEVLDMQAAQQSPAILTLLVTLERYKGESIASQREALKPSVSHPSPTRLQPRRPPLSDPTLPLSSSHMAATVDADPSVATADNAAATVNNAAATVSDALATADQPSASPIRDKATAVPATTALGTALPPTNVLAVLVTADLASLATKFLNVVALAVASRALAVLVTLPVVMEAPTEPAHGEKIVGKTTFQQLEVEISCQV